MPKQRAELAAGRETTIRKLKSSITKSRPKAVEIRTVLRAKGRLFVRVTCLSIFLSHRSLAIQPAPLTHKPPAIINNTRLNGGGALGVIHSDQPAGINKISLPLGLFQRSNRAHCPSRFENDLFFTNVSIAKTLEGTFQVVANDGRVLTLKALSRHVKSRAIY